LLPGTLEAHTVQHQSHHSFKLADHASTQKWSLIKEYQGTSQLWNQSADSTTSGREGSKKGQQNLLGPIWVENEW
jgi:hypothetical protein